MTQSAVKITCVLCNHKKLTIQNTCVFNCPRIIVQKTAFTGSVEQTIGWSRYWGLSDSRMSKVISNLLSPRISSVVELDASRNSLTIIPNQISKLFTTSCDIALWSNSITSILSGAFASPQLEQLPSI